MGVPGNANALLLRSAAAAGGYQVSRSLRFNSSDSVFLSRTPASAGNRQIFTWSGWIKRSAFGGRQNFFQGGNHTAGSNSSYFEFGSSDILRVAEWNGSSETYTLESTQVFRDSGAWLHLLVAFDTTQATASNRIKVYVNGAQITVFTTANYPAQNASTSISNNVIHNIGRDPSAGISYFSGYLADIHFIDGLALDPSSFATTDATTGQWIPKAYTGSYGTNGFKLTFADNSNNTASTLGKDTSGNGNNWTPNNLSVTAGAGNDSLVDTPTSYGTDTGAGGEVRGNYCTFNPLNKQSSCTLSNGNLDYVSGTTTASSSAWGTFNIPTSGKWYWEYTLTATAEYSFCGISTPLDTSKYALYYGINGTLQTDAGITSGGGTLANNDVLGVAVNVDAGTIAFYKNGVSQLSVSYATSSGLYAPIARSGTNNQTPALSANFGQRPFAYTAPSGFKALCDTNLPAPVVAQPSTVMDVKLYTGNGSTQTISGLGFSPDLVWIKNRTLSQDHMLQDQVRGATAWLSSNRTAAENTNTSSDWFRAFTSDGFTVAYQTTGGLATNEWNASGSAYAAWCWDAGSSTVTNTQGSISSQVRANASAGFSIVTYTGTGANASVGHGCGTAPSLIIIKARTQATARNWAVYHSSIGATKILELSTTNAAQTVNFWQDTAPTSTVFTLSSQGDVNASTYNYVAYCFAPVAGYSSFGSYTGNGSADGPFVYTGFRPRWVMIKPLYQYDGGGSTVASTAWYIYDSARGSYNANGAILGANNSYAEENNATDIDFLSNGFKLRNVRAVNTSNGAIYAAFAESPFQFSRAR